MHAAGVYRATLYKVDPSENNKYWQPNNPL